MNKLHTITAEDLQNRTYEPTPFLVDELILKIRSSEFKHGSLI